MISIKPHTINSEICLLCSQTVKVKGKKHFNYPKANTGSTARKWKQWEEQFCLWEMLCPERIKWTFLIWRKDGIPNMFLIQNLLSPAWHIFPWNILPRSYFGKAGAFPGSLAGNSGQFPSALPWIAVWFPALS